MADDDDETIDAADDEAADPDDDAPGDEDAPARRRGLDGRTLAICALVALIAAALAGLVTNHFTRDDDDPAQAAELTLAEEAPDIVLPRLGGGDDIRISDYRGQPIVVNFWASWCGPCIEEMPDFQRVHESLGDQVAFLGVNVNDAEEAAARMVDRTGVTYDLARDPDGELVRSLEVTNFPSTFLIDEDGTIVDVARSNISAERLCEKVNQSLLNQSLEECG